MQTLRKLLMAGAVALGAGGAAAEPFRLIVTHLEPPLVPNSVMDIAAAQGLFAAEGVDVEIVRVQQTPSALAALQAGEGDMANIATDALHQLVLQGVGDIVAVASPNKSLPFLIAGKAEIASPADLEGRSFGVGRIGSLDHSLSTKVLESQGVDMAEVEIVTLGQPGVRAQALAAGQVDATTMSIGVWSTIPDPTGLHVIIDQDAYYAAAPVVDKVNVVTAETLETRGDVVEAVIRALVKLSRQFAETPQTWIEAMAAARPDVERATLEMLAGAFADSWSVNGGLGAAELDFTAGWLYETGDFQGRQPPPLDAWVEFGPVDAVLAELGAVDGMDEPTR